MANTYHTGRTQRIREFLARNSNEAFTAREVLNAVEPGGSIDLVAATLATMASKGKIARVGAANKRVHYFWPRELPKPDKRRTAGDKPLRAQAVRRAERAAAPVRNPKPLRAATPRTTAEIAKAISAIAISKGLPAPRRAEGNFVAPIASGDHAFTARRAASASLAADIADFERRGGRIERLGSTRLFHHPDDCAE